MDITQIIQQQHDSQRSLFAALEQYPRDDIEGLTAIWEQVRTFLLCHADAEEVYFYPELAKIGTGGGDAESNTEQIEDAIHDHNDLRDAIRRTDAAEVGSAAWWTAVVDANVANSEHMAEEERQDLADFRQQASLELRHTIAVAFLRRMAQRWDDPVIRNRDADSYVQQAQKAPESSVEKEAEELLDTGTPLRTSKDPEPSLKASSDE